MDKLRTIVIALPKAELILTSIVGSYKLFNSANILTNSNTRIIIAGLKNTEEFFDGIFSLKTHCDFSSVKNPDLIIIPSFKSDVEAALSYNKELIDWISESYKKGTYIASLCSGSFLLAASGILDGKECTCHFAHSEQFQALFPRTHFKKNEVITECNGIFTSGGSFTFLNLIIYLIERFYGVEVARQLYKTYQIDYYRKFQDTFTVMETKKSHGDATILKAQEYMESNYPKAITIAEIAKEVNLGDRTLSRKFKQMTNETVYQYLQKIRIEKAKLLLTETKKNISEIQYEVGFNDYKSFRSIFLKLTKTSPSAYRRQFQIISG